MKDLIQQLVTDYINGPNPLLGQQTQLLQELCNFGTKQDAVFFGQKAHRIYVKAIVRKKIPLAQRIKNKYGHLFPRPDDASLSIGFAIMADSKRK